MKIAFDEISCNSPHLDSALTDGVVVAAVAAVVVVKLALLVDQVFGVDAEEQADRKFLKWIIDVKMTD